MLCVVCSPNTGQVSLLFNGFVPTGIAPVLPNPYLGVLLLHYGDTLHYQRSADIITPSLSLQQEFQHQIELLRLTLRPRYGQSSLDTSNQVPYCFGGKSGWSELN